jgi:hypothetical protein
MSVNGAFITDENNLGNNDIKISDILNVNKKDLSIQLTLNAGSIVENKNYSNIIYKKTDNYNYSDVLSYNKNKCLTTKNYFEISDILKHNLIPDTSRCINECKIKSIYKYFEISLSSSIINNEKFCWLVLSYLLYDCYNTIIVPNKYCVPITNLYFDFIQKNEIYEMYPYLYSTGFLQFIKLLNIKKRADVKDERSNGIEGKLTTPENFITNIRLIKDFYKEKMLFLIHYFRFFSATDGNNSNDWENFRHSTCYIKYYQYLQPDRENWRINDGGIIASRKNIVVPSFQHNYNDADRERYFDNSNDDWKPSGSRCLNSKTHILNKYSRKVGIPIVCGISGTTLPMCWKILCYLNIELNKKGDVLRVRRGLFIYILACYSFLASDGGHSLNEVLSSFKMIFCIIENEKGKNNPNIPFSPNFINECNNFFHDILIYDQSFSGKHEIKQLEQDLLIAERNIYIASEKNIPMKNPEQNYYQFFKKFDDPPNLQILIFNKTEELLARYMNYYCPLQKESIYKKSKFNFFKKENNETMAFGKYKKKKYRKRTFGSPGKRTFGSPGKRTFGSPGKRTFGSPGKRTFGSPGKRTFGSPGKRTFGSSGKRTFGSPGKRTFGSPGKRTFGSSGKRTFVSPGKRTFGSSGKRSKEENI